MALAVDPDTASIGLAGIESRAFCGSSVLLKRLQSDLLELKVFQEFLDTESGGSFNRTCWN